MGHDHPRRYPTQDFVPASVSAARLVSDFLDGILDACSEQTRIVDAWEYSYPYKQRKRFEEAYTTVKQESVEWTAAPDRYRRHVEAGFGIWMDWGWRQVGWNLDDFSKNHFTPEEFQTAVRAALDVSDEYVWIYTEQPRWWTNERLPTEYVEALQQAREPLKKAENPQPVRLIFDTDMMADVDDVGAAALLHALADRGEVEVLAMGLSGRNPWSSLCLDALNTFFRRLEIPIGVVKGPAFDKRSKYAETIAEEFPRNLKAADDNSILAKIAAQDVSVRGTDLQHLAVTRIEYPPSLLIHARGNAARATTPTGTCLTMNCSARRFVSWGFRLSRSGWEADIAGLGLLQFLQPGGGGLRQGDVLAQLLE